MEKRNKKKRRRPNSALSRLVPTGFLPFPVIRCACGEERETFWETFRNDSDDSRIANLWANGNLHTIVYFLAFFFSL